MDDYNTIPYFEDTDSKDTQMISFALLVYSFIFAVLVATILSFTDPSDAFPMVPPLCYSFEDEDEEDDYRTYSHSQLVQEMLQPNTQTNHTIRVVEDSDGVLVTQAVGTQTDDDMMDTSSIE